MCGWKRSLMVMISWFFDSKRLSRAGVEGCGVVRNMQVTSNGFL